VRLLLDTHTLLWWFEEDPRLSSRAEAMIADRRNDIYVSAATAWEIFTKHRLGKLPLVGTILEDFRAGLTMEGFEEISVTVAHACHAGWLKGTHKDPFDRMLMAQAQLEGLTLVSKDEAYDRFGVPRVW
jgi:PIN domain nuclease of toxin-antitoxin system